MAKKPDIKTVNSGFTSRETINENFESLRDAFENTLSRGGETPNAMDADVDMNSNDLLNVKNMTVDKITLRGQDLASLLNLDGDGNEQVTINTQAYNCDGATSNFTLPEEPVSENNVMVFLDGVYQQKDAFSLSGSTLIMSEIPVNGSVLEASVVTPVVLNTADSANVTHTPTSTGTQENLDDYLDGLETDVTAAEADIDDLEAADEEYELLLSKKLDNADDAASLSILKNNQNNRSVIGQPNTYEDKWQAVGRSGLYDILGIRTNGSTLPTSSASGAVTVTFSSAMEAVPQFVAIQPRGTGSNNDLSWVVDNRTTTGFDVTIKQGNTLVAVDFMYFALEGVS